MSEASVYQDLRGHLATLRLAAAAEALPGALEGARADKLSHTAFLEKLLKVEVDATVARRQASLARFVCLPSPWRIADFDFDAQPSVDRKLVEDLACLRFLMASHIHSWGEVRPQHLRRFLANEATRRPAQSAWPKSVPPTATS